MQKIKEFALSMQKIYKFCIADAENKKLVKSTTKINTQIYSQFAFPLPKIKRFCIANAENQKYLHC